MPLVHTEVIDQTDPISNEHQAVLLLLAADDTPAHADELRTGDHGP